MRVISYDDTLLLFTYLYVAGTRNTLTCFSLAKLMNQNYQINFFDKIDLLKNFYVFICKIKLLFILNRNLKNVSAKVLQTKTV